MTNPVEALFSVYFSPSPPYLFRLLRREFALSDRITMILYRKKSGEMVKCDLIRNRRRGNFLCSFFTSSVVGVMDPEGMIDIISKTKESANPIYFSGYQWKWTKDHSVLRMVAYEGGFDLKHEEVIRLGEIIQDQRNPEVMNG